MDVRVEVKVSESMRKVEYAIRDIVVYAKHVTKRANDLLSVHWRPNRELFNHVEII